MKKILAMLMFFSLTMTAFSQEIVHNTTQTNTTLQAAQELPKEGTYQILANGREDEVVIPSEILLQINDRREANTDVIIPVSDQVSILVFSFRKIRKEGLTSPAKEEHKD